VLYAAIPTKETTFSQLMAQEYGLLKAIEATVCWKVAIRYRPIRSREFKSLIKGRLCVGPESMEVSIAGKSSKKAHAILKEYLRMSS
jgi:hypothetical protein